jgi:hypothetical protein
MILRESAGETRAQDRTLRLAFQARRAAHADEPPAEAQASSFAWMHPRPLSWRLESRPASARVALARDAPVRSVREDRMAEVAKGR